MERVMKIDHDHDGVEASHDQRPLAARERLEAAEARWLTAFLHGPTRTRWSRLPPQVGDPAPRMELPDATGRVRRLDEWMSVGPIHLVFLRHFGCSCLSERWDRLRDELEAIIAAGATTIAVSQAEPPRTAEVAARRGYPFPILCDPERVTYEAFGLVEGTPAQVLHDFRWRPNDRETADTLIASRAGTERAVVDDPWQLPGEFVIAKGGQITLAHRYQYCEDFPPQTVLLGAIAAANVGAP
jgi:peroxiredoxin